MFVHPCRIARRDRLALEPVESVGPDSYDLFVIGSEVDDRDVSGAFAAQRDALARVAALDWSSLSSAELVDAVQQWEVHQRRSAAVSHALVGELDTPGGSR